MKRNCSRAIVEEKKKKRKWRKAIEKNRNKGRRKTKGQTKNIEKIINFIDFVTRGAYILRIGYIYENLPKLKIKVGESQIWKGILMSIPWPSFWLSPNNQHIY